MEKDLRQLIASWSNDQIHPRQRVSQDWEYAQLAMDPSIQSFQWWGIGLIGRLPKTMDGNRWIITTIDYATDWPIAKAISKATEEAIAEFIYDEIYMHYGAPQEIFTDGGRWKEPMVRCIAKVPRKDQDITQRHESISSPYEWESRMVGRHNWHNAWKVAPE